MSGMANPDASASRRRGRNSEADAIMAMMAKTIDVSRLQLKRLKNEVEQFHHLEGSEGGNSLGSATSEGKYLASSTEVRTALYADLHLLFIKLHEADQLLSRLKRLMPHELELAHLRNRHRALLKKCDEFRRHLECVDGTYLADAGNLSDSTFSFHGKKFDLGPELEGQVEDLMQDVVLSWGKIRDRQKRIRELISRGPIPQESST